MRFIPLTTLFALTLFLGGCFHIPQDPLLGDASDTQIQPTTTVSNNGIQYPPGTSIEGKTELRYTADGKKVYNNPELGLYFEYPEEWKVKGEKNFPYLNNPNTRIGSGHFINLLTNGDQRVEIRLESADFFIEGTDANFNVLGNMVINFKNESSEQIKKIYPACIVEFHDRTNGMWATVFMVSFFGLPGMSVESFTQPSSKFDNVYVSFSYPEDITDMVETETDKISYASSSEVFNKFCKEEVSDDIKTLKSSQMYTEYVDILESMKFSES